MSMKEESLNESNTDQQEKESRKQVIERKRRIRKEKVMGKTGSQSNMRDMDTKRLVREERARVQKIKNREAAQKSRDSQKGYLKQLEEEVHQLKEFLNNSRKYCWNCKRQLQNSTFPDNTISGQPNETWRVVQSTESILESESSLVQFPTLNNSPSDLFEDDFLMREDDNSSSCSRYFQAGLLIFALLAVFSINSVVNSHGASRALMQIQGEEVKQGSTDTLKKMEERNRSKDHAGQGDGNATAVVKVEEKEEHGLIALNNDCIKSLMKVERASSQLQKSLTSYSDSTYASNYPSYQEGILLCQLRMPKPQRRPQFRTPLVRLYLLGSQLKDLVSNFNLMLPTHDGESIQASGIYQVSARIKQVSRVTNHNCLS